MGGVCITYTARHDANAEDELDSLAAVYACLLKKKAAEPTPEPDGRSDAAKVEYEKEVSHVEQRPDKRSEIVITNSRK